MRFFYSVFFLLCGLSSFAQTYVSEVWQADRGDSTYSNPIIYADYSDPDVIRVDDDYYMTASSFNCVPGLPILHSKDLVNWRIVNHALPRLDMEGVPEGFFDSPQHGRGVWAPCLRYHDGEYMIYWGDPDFGIYVVKTRDILGRWDEPILVLPGKGRIDPSPLFDDDGRVYLVHAWAGSRARFNSVMTICELSPDGTKALGEEVLVYDGLSDGNHTVEGGKLYKKDGYYYMLAPAGGVATGWQLAFRSKNIYGPYEVKRVLAQGTTDINGPHQGGLVETQTGEWWFAHFQDVGTVGRIVHLQPVEWRDGWPVMGENARDYCGEPVAAHRKPNVGKTFPIEIPAESDEFDVPFLGLQWQWHANPRPPYGYTSPYGYLRLYGQYYPEEYVNFWDIPNLLMQKLPAPAFTATTKLSATLLNEGDKTGLVVMGYDYAYIAVVKTKTGYALEYKICTDAEQKSPERVVTSIELQKIKVNEKYNYLTPIPDAEIYLRVKVKEGGICTFGYSVDGEIYESLPEAFQAREGKWIGAKTGLFIMNKEPQSPRSWVDADWFRISHAACKSNDVIEISSLEELARYAALNGNSVKLLPGTYKMIDYLTQDSIPARVERGQYSYIEFTGSGNTFDFEGVTLELDTRLRKMLSHPMHTNELFVTGSGNTMKGLTIRNIGHETSPGGAVFCVEGVDNTIDGFTIHVQGSFPYGYGDLFGKGGPDVIRHSKHSGFLTTGNGTKILNTILYMRSFGHGFYIQKSASDVYFENCYVEGELFSTDDVLKETSGPAFDVDFRTWTANREGKYTVTPGYTKSTCEEGFRTYNRDNRNITFVNCTAKNTRGGFELRTNGGVKLENCTTIGTERAYWVGNDAVIKNCKGDANYGPLLFLEGSNANVDLIVSPAESDRFVHSLATIQGTNNSVVLRPEDGRNRTKELPILVGYTHPEHGEAMSPYGEAPCVGLTLTNETTMPVILGEQSKNCYVKSKGKVTENKGNITDCPN